MATTPSNAVAIQPIVIIAKNDPVVHLKLVGATAAIVEIRPDKVKGLSLFDTHKATTASRFISANELANLCVSPRVGAKETAPLITPFRSEGKKQHDAVKARFHALVIDHDHDDLTREQIGDKYKGLRLRYLAFTTSSHQQEVTDKDSGEVLPPVNRWKVVIPYNCSIDYKQHEALAKGVAISLGTDAAQARKQQGFYAPNKLTADAPFESINQLHEGEWLDPDGDSKLVQDARVLYELWSEERDTKARNATPKPRAEGLDVGIIGKINGHYDIRELLEEHDYVDMGKWLSPKSESGSPGVHIYPGGGKERVYSHHGGTDLLSAQNHGGHALDTADVLCCLKYGGDYSRMIREEAGELDQHGQKERQTEYVQQKELASLCVVSDEAGNVVSHPLAKVIPLNGVLQTPRWLLPGFMVEGLTLIAGRHGVGKTTALLPLAAGVAGFHKPDWGLKPKHWRHVIYVTEDMQQAQRVLQGLIGHLSITDSEMNERLHLVEARRMKAEVLVKVGDIYTKKYTRWADGVNLPPLVVLDTQSATIELENENDNSEASKAVAAFKQQFNGLPVWLIAHVAKTKSDVKNLTSRGASAWEADANATAFIVQEDGNETVNDARWIMLGKRRFEPEWSEVLLEDHTCSAESVDGWGDKEQTMIRWAIANPGGGTRKENQSAELDRAILAAVQEAWEAGEPVNKTACKQKVGGTSEMVGRAIDKLIIDKWLAEIQIPKDKRPHHTKKSYLIALTETERNTFNITSKLPEAKTAIPEGIKGGKLA